jgi:hypothetical protein
MPKPLLHQVKRDASGYRCNPVAMRRPLGEAAAPSSPADSITTCAALQPVIRDHGHTEHHALCRAGDIASPGIECLVNPPGLGVLCAEGLWG